MKNYTFGLLISIAFAATGLSQPSLQWASRFNGPIANDKGNAIAVDAGGRVYVTGPSDNSSGTSDYLTIKYKANGDTAWSRRYNGSAGGQDEPVAIKVDASGNVYVTGKSTGTGTGFDIVTIKYDSIGNEVWTKVFNGAANKDDIGYNLIVDVFGNVYVVGSSFYLSGSTKTDGVVIKYSSSAGMLPPLWKINIVGGSEIANLIEINSFDNLVVTHGSSINSSYRILEINPLNGTVIHEWNTFVSPCFSMVVGFPNAMVLDPAANMYVLSTANHFGVPEVHVAMFSYVSSGCSSWDYYTAANGSATISGVDLKIDVDVNIYELSDYYNGNRHYYYFKKHYPSGPLWWTKTYNFTPNANADDIPVSLSLGNNLTKPDLYITGNMSTGDINIAKFNNDGDTLWHKTYDCGNHGPDAASKMVMDACDNLYITGHSNCDGTSKDVKTIKYSTSTPPIITPVGPTTICQGGSVTLAADACSGCTYLWSTGQTTPSIVVSPTVTTDYKVTVANSTNCSAGSLPTTVTVNPILIPSVSIVATMTTICSGQNVTFTPTPTNGGATPTYQWFVNQSWVETGATYSTTTLTNGSQVYCTMTSNAVCANPAVVTSNSIPVTVHPQLVSGVSITASSTSICSGDTVTFMAEPSNGGTSPAYQWYVNGATVAGANGPEYSTTTLANGSQVYCTMTTNAACANPLIATSNSFTMTVNPIRTPGVSITASSTSICSGDLITFTATPANGGATPFYQWYVNGAPVGANSPMYSDTTLTHGSLVFCVMTSSAACVSPLIAASNSLVVTVNQPTIPNVSIGALPTSICSGQKVTFTATPTNGGATPFYQWYVDSAPVGPNNPKYSTMALTNGTPVYCVMTSSAVCATPPVVTSNSLMIAVKPLLVPGVTVTASSVSICPGDTVMFTATPTNGGSAPFYQWYVNGSPVGDSSQTYSTATLTNGAQVYCAMTSTADCVNPVMATSNSFTITVKPSVIPSVSITSDSSCTLFIATPTDGGSSPYYQWYVNYIPVAGDSQTYSNLTLEDSTKVYCVMTSNAACANPATAQSNMITIPCIVKTKEYENLGRIVVFPNPASGYFTIEGTGLASGLYRIHLNNMLGQTLLEKSMRLSAEDFTVQLNVEGFPSGNYYIVLYSEASAYTVPVLKN